MRDLDEERTHPISVELEENAGVIDLFVTITGTTPWTEPNNDGENSSNTSLEIIPSKLSEKDVEHYVSSMNIFLLSFSVDRSVLEFSFDSSIDSTDLRCGQSGNQK